MMNNYKIFIVNSFYDEASKQQINLIANNLGCDFLNIEKPCKKKFEKC